MSVLMPVYKPPSAFFERAVESVLRQSHANFELCIADDCSRSSALDALLADYASRDRRVKVLQRRDNGGIAEATNSAFSLATGEWIALLDHDDMLAEGALAEVVAAIGRNPAAQLFYSDEDKIDERGRRFSPYFKPDFSYELFRSQNYLNHLTVHRADNIRRVGGWRSSFDGSQDYDLNLRVVESVAEDTVCHIPRILYHWRSHARSTASKADQKSYALTSGARALAEHLQRTDIDAAVDAETVAPFYRLRPSAAPSATVSVVLLGSNGPELQSVAYRLWHSTTHKAVEFVLVPEDSKLDQAVRSGSSHEDSPLVKSVRSPSGSWAARANAGASVATGEFLCILDAGFVPRCTDWLSELIFWAGLEGVGAVAPKTYYKNSRIRHVGYVCGANGFVAAAYLNASGHISGYFSRLRLAANVSAVSGACLTVRRCRYDAVCGFDEQFHHAFGDIDFCLKLMSAGFRNIVTPFAEMECRETFLRSRDDVLEQAIHYRDDANRLKERWDLSGDKYYSPHLNRRIADFSLNMQPKDMGS